MSTRLNQLEALFKALGDETRLRILGLLLAGEVCVCDIHESLRIPQPKASRHLAYLRKAGLVTTRRDGLWIHYRLGASDDAVLRTLTDAVQHALTHVDSLRRDATRLQSRNRCCLPMAVKAAVPSCCEGAAGSASATRAGR